MIEFTEGSYIVGLWFASCPKTNDNWMCCVQRSSENPNRYYGTYRFRYNKDDKIFDSDDEKSWQSFQSKFDETEEAVIKSINDIHDVIGLKYPEKDFLLIQGGVEKFLEKARTVPWMNMKVESIKKD